jgi:hypothetical protein
MNTKELLEGLNILRPYYVDPDGYTIGAEHDQIYAYSTDFPLAQADVARMCALGWFQPDAKVPDDKDFGPDYYNPEEGWSAYV